MHRSIAITDRRPIDQSEREEILDRAGRARESSHVVLCASYGYARGATGLTRRTCTHSGNSPPSYRCSPRLRFLPSSLSPPLSLSLSTSGLLDRRSTPSLLQTLTHIRLSGCMPSSSVLQTNCFKLENFLGLTPDHLACPLLTAPLSISAFPTCLPEPGRCS